MKAIKVENLKKVYNPYSAFSKVNLFVLWELLVQEKPH